VAAHDVEVRAAVLRATNEPLRVEPIRLRAVGQGDVRVRIDVTGVCHSDLSLARGVLEQPLPAVLGHEACGTVVETGAAARHLEGQRVILLWIAPCGRCFHCLRGEGHLCDEGAKGRDVPHAVDAAGEPVYPGLSVGSFAEETVVPATSVVPVPDDVSSEDAALLGCAVTTGVGAAVKTARVQPGSSVLVLGLGGVGASVVQGARLAGAETVVAVDRNPEKAALAEAAGATHFVPAGEDAKRTVRGLTGGRGVDYSFDCVGASATVREAWSLARRGGTACVVGIGPKDDRVAFSALELFHFARTLVGCVAGSVDARADLPRFFDWVREGKLDVGGLVTGRGTLADVEGALDRLAAGEGLRTLLTPR
jgi:S-(hydroxymethyl)glutathione dehydrogenase/alcohol dehydrogenase